MAKNGTYKVCYTYAQENAAGTLILETGRSAILGPFTVSGSLYVEGQYSDNARINKVYIYCTLDGGGVYYKETEITNVVGTGTWGVTLSMSDATLGAQATAYFTNKSYETKRLYSDGVLPPLAYMVEAAGRLWGTGRMARAGTNEAATLYWSELAPNWNDWPVANANDRFAQPTTGLYEWNELVYVFTRDARWRVTPSTYNEGMRFYKLEGQKGCLGGHTIAKVGQGVMWWAPQGFVVTVGDEEPKVISGDIKSTLQSVRKDRARFAVARYDTETQRYYCWLSTSGSELNDLCVIADFTGGLDGVRWTVAGGLGRTVYSLGSGVMPDGELQSFCGDHLGCVYQEGLSASDGANEGGTYQGTLSYGTTSSTTTTTTTTTTT